MWVWVLVVVLLDAGDFGGSGWRRRVKVESAIVCVRWFVEASYIEAVFKEGW